MRMALLAACAVAVSCAGSSDRAAPRPVAATPVEEPVDVPVVAVPGEAPAPETVGRAKLWAGSVRFVGFSERELDEFRVIPEQRSSVYRPRNTDHQGVDGFWWKGERNHWFKIPGHCVVVVSRADSAGGAPRADEGDEEVIAGGGRPRIWSKCKPWLTRILVSGGRISKAGWYPNAGTSAIGAGYPW